MYRCSGVKLIECQQKKMPEHTTVQKWKVNNLNELINMVKFNKEACSIQKKQRDFTYY